MHELFDTPSYVQMARESYDDLNMDFVVLGRLPVYLTIAANSYTHRFACKIIVKMLTIVDILTFMSRINFMLNRVEHENKFNNVGPRLCLNLPTLPQRLATV